MTLSIASYTALIQEHSAYIAALQNALASLNNVIAAGTLLFNDPNYAATFGNVAGYTTYLGNCKTDILAFIAAYPVEPAVQF